MILKRLIIKNFRNHYFSSFEFEKGINVLTGENASGKTNVVEAIDYLSILKSFRGVDDKDLIQMDKQLAANISAIIYEGDLKREINICITETGKKVLVNKKSVRRLSELANIVNVILFEPNDVMLFRGLPKERRNFLDLSIGKKSYSYLDYLNRYEKVLQKRNDLLKTDNIDNDLLAINTEMLIKLSGPIINYRTMYLKDINDILNKIACALTGAKQNVKIVYKPFVKYDSNFEKNARSAFEKSLEQDKKHKTTSIGIHREDFTVNLNNRDISIFGSQGENRIIALALKLSSYFLINDEDKKPIVILDDVMSELDVNHQKRLLKFLNKFNQVFITGTKLVVNGATHYHIEKNSITKEVF